MFKNKINKQSIKKLYLKSNQIRRDTLKMVYHAQSGHLGGAFSSAEMVVSLYYDLMNIIPHQPDWELRDRFILSKGHACPILYTTLADKGYFKKEECNSFRCLGSILQGHPDINKCPWLDATTGSLGAGLSIGVGMALASKYLKRSNYIYVIIGDGECQEGQIWEAAMSASKYQLDNLIVFLDYNKIQVDGFVDEVMPIEPINDKWRAFNWDVQEIDGHNIQEILSSVYKAWDSDIKKPHMIVAHTIKGKGVSFMENKPRWHSGAPNEKEFLEAMKELEDNI